MSKTMNTGAACAAATLSACCLLDCECQPSPPPTAEAAVRLDSSFSSWIETSAAVAKDPAKGWQLFVFGYGNGLQASIKDFKTVPAPTANQGIPPMPATDTEHWANDQLNVQLANGDVLLAWNGLSQIPDATLQATASWWNTWPTEGGVTPDHYETTPPTHPARNGRRPAILFWRYSVSNGTWAVSGVLDSAHAGGVDPAGKVISDYCAQSVPWVLGFDRPEVYADPWGVDPKDGTKQRLYASTTCRRGKLNANKEAVVSDGYRQVFLSSDSGVTWKPSSFRLSDSGVSVMTATPTGRVFMLQEGIAADGAAAPVVYWSDDFGHTLSAATPFDSPVDLTYRVPAKDGAAAQSYPYAALGCAQTGVGAPGAYPPFIATVGPGAVLVVYPSVETVTVNGAQVTRQISVATMLLASRAGEPTVMPVAVIRPKADAGSVVMSSLITDDRPVSNPASLLYWMETTARPAAKDACKTPVDVIARYTTFAGISQFPGPIKNLSSGSFQRTPPPADDPTWSFGDYMKGTSYVDTVKNALTFVPVWSQEAAGRMTPYIRLIHIELPPSGNEPAPVQVPGLKSTPIADKIKAMHGRPKSMSKHLLECDTCRREVAPAIERPRLKPRRASRPARCRWCGVARWAGCRRSGR